MNTRSNNTQYNFTATSLVILRVKLKMSKHTETSQGRPYSNLIVFGHFGKFGLSLCLRLEYSLDGEESRERSARKESRERARTHTAHAASDWVYMKCDRGFSRPLRANFALS